VGFPTEKDTRGVFRPTRVLNGERSGGWKSGGWKSGVWKRSGDFYLRYWALLPRPLLGPRLLLLLLAPQVPSGQQALLLRLLLLLQQPQQEQQEQQEPQQPRLSQLLGGPDAGHLQ